MAQYPKIDSPCPIKGRERAETGIDFCKVCERSVHNLSAMTESERKRFMASCTGPVCVSYTVKRKREQKIVWAMAMAATVAVAPGIASAHCDPVEVMEDTFTEEGGVKDPGNVQWFDDEKPQELPVIVDPEFMPDGDTQSS
jgi:hypothetical protein